MSLTRQTQKVFCSNANANQLAVFGTMKTGTPVYSTSLATLQSQEYTQGWVEAILNDKAPFLEEMNAVQYGLSYQIAYLLQEGIAVYDAGTNYSDTSIVKVIDTNGLSFYRSLIDNNIGHSLSDPNYWELIPIANILPQITNKADVDLANVSNTSGFRKLVEVSSPSILPDWYKVYDEYDPTTGTYIGKWCEQGGIKNVSGSQTITLRKSYADTNYNIFIQLYYNANSGAPTSANVNPFIYTGSTAMDKSKFSYYAGSTFVSGVYWRTCGYIEE